MKTGTIIVIGILAGMSLLSAGSIGSAAEPSAAGTVSMNVLVLVNSDSPFARQGNEYVLPYLEHFGVPFTLADVSKQNVDFSLGQYAIVVISHPQITPKGRDIENVLLDAVRSGCGLVSFDPNLPKLSPTLDANSANVTTLEFSATPHFITARHNPGEKRKLFGPMTLPRFSAGDGKVLVSADGCPLLITSQAGKGRIVQWTSQDWMHTSVLGPLAGLDDCLWRSMVWAARKPYAMRGLPPLVTMRVDDVAGRGGLWNQSPFYWVKTCGKYNFKPWLGLFIYNLTSEAIEELRGYIRDGQATASPHALGRPPREKENQDFYYNPKAIPLRAYTYDEFIYFDHQHKRPWSDEEAQRGLKAVDDWYAETNLPMSKYFVPHYSEVGRNIIPYVADKWHMEFAMFYMQPGLPYGDSSPWTKCGPFRLYEKPGTCTNRENMRGNRPVYYADSADVDGHKLFNCFTEIRDNAGYEWAPDNDVNATIGRGVRQLRRALDSMALAVLFTHETDYIFKIKPENWEKEIKAIAEGIADYNPVFSTTDNAMKIVRAHRTSRLNSCAFNPSSETVKAELTGAADVPTSFYLFTEEGNRITWRLVPVPAFTEKTAVEADCKIAR